MSEAAETAGQARPATLEATGPSGATALFELLVAGVMETTGLRAEAGLLPGPHRPAGDSPPRQKLTKTLMTSASFSMFNIQVKLLIMQLRGL